MFPRSFPQRDYVPFGYLDNPWHSSVLNRSGVVRSVPPLGFGYWCRRMPWAYGDGTRRQLNYLSILQPSILVDGSRPDFKHLVSRYHTKNAMTYDFEHRGVRFRLCYFLIGEQTLACRIEMDNVAGEPRQVVLHASHIYGYPETRWWGSDGFVSREGQGTTAVAKIWAYGDVFVLRCEPEPQAYRATVSRDELDAWTGSEDLASNSGASSRCPEPVYSLLSSSFEIGPGESKQTLIALTRGVNEKWANEASLEACREAESVLATLLDEDQAFYELAPMLEGDWPDDWKNGWVYDLETLRMCIRRPLGIFKHHWDGMQIFGPRAVLGESLIDALCLSYADMELAKDVILGTFADAPMPNVPCTREDGSMNMIGMGGEECGTAPIWVLPFRTIRSVFERDRDVDWLRSLWPHLENFVQWWLDHRRDAHGRFFCNNSWESGQDGSQRFLLSQGEEAKEAEYVQTVDVEAAMADAMLSLAYLAPFAGQPERTAHWRKLGEEIAANLRAMFVDGWFRDFDARTGLPILLPDYLDVMMLLPVSLGLATADQIESVKPKFLWFLEHPKHWLEWPSFLFCFTEAGWNAGSKKEMSTLVAQTADRVYARTNGREPIAIGRHPANMPDPFNYRIPGTSNEFWPVDGELPSCGAEAYGWDATLPTLILRNVLGFREHRDGFTLEPNLPESLLVTGREYRVSDLRFRDRRFDVVLRVEPDLSVSVSTNPIEDGSVCER